MLDLTAEVFLIGAVSEVLPYLCAADFYLSASRSEGLPFNVMEAMAVGLPIAASEVKGQTDLLAESEALLYPAENLDALCDAVERMIASGVRGVGSCHYPQLSRYRLCEVVDENLAVLRDGWERIDENQ